MKQMRRRLLAAILTMSMVLTLLPAAALAEDDAALETPETVQTAPGAETIEPGMETDAPEVTGPAEETVPPTQAQPEDPADPEEPQPTAAPTPEAGEEPSVELLAEGEPELSAATCPTSIERVTATDGDVTITTANVFLIGQGGKAEVRIEITGLDGSSGWKVKDSTWDTDRDLGLSIKDGERIWNYTESLTDTGPKEYHLTLSNIPNSESPDPVTLGPFAVSTYVAQAEELLPTVAELNKEPEVISAGDDMPAFNSYLMPGTLTYDDLDAILVKDGVTYAASTPMNPVKAYSGQWTDIRYQDMFAGYYRPQLNCERIWTVLNCGRPLTAGSYDLVFRQSGTEVLTLTDRVRVSVRPLVSVSEGVYSNLGHWSSEEGDTEVYGHLSLEGAIPQEVELQLLADDQQVGKVADIRIAASSGDTMTVQYRFEVPEPLDRDKNYMLRAVAVDGGTLEGETERKVNVQPSGQKQIVTAEFSNYYYANVIATTRNTSPDCCYKAVLKDDQQQVVAEAFVNSDENGVFDVEFTDEDGSPVALTPDTYYHMELRSWNDWQNDWEQYGVSSQSLSTYGREAVNALSLLSEGDTVSLSLMTSSVSIDDGVIHVYLRGDDLSAISDDSQFTLSATSVAGGTPVSFHTFTVTRNRTGEKPEYAYLSAEIPSEMEEGYYWCKLFYGGKEVVDAAAGVNVLSQKYPTELSASPKAYDSSTLWNGLRFHYGLFCNNASRFTDGVRLELYRQDNLSSTPDRTITWDEAQNDLAISAGSEPDPMPQRYRGVIWTGDLPLHTSELAYWITGETRTAMDLGELPDCSVTAQPAEHGALEILPCAGGTADAVPAWTEIYVKGVPEEGYQLKPNSVCVNGQPIRGRGLLVTEGNYTITAEFEPIPKQTHAVKVYDYIYSGNVSVGVSAAAEGETVTVKAEPNENYAVTRIYYRRTNGDQGPEVAIKKDDTGAYTFTMPAAAITIYAEFHYRTSYPIAVEYDGNCGSVFAGNSAREGDTVTVNAGPYLGFGLASLTCEYYDPSKEESVVLDLLQSPSDGSDQYTFVMPDASVIIRGTFFAKEQYTVTCPSLEGGWIYPSSYAPYAGDVVQVECDPYGGYRLASLGYYPEGHPESVTAIPQGSDGTWSFVMPECNVVLTAEFVEQQQHTVTCSYVPEQGSVWTDTASVYDGEAVVVYCSAGADYRLVSLYYTLDSDPEQANVPIDQGTDGTWSFVMPVDDVTVWAVFESWPSYTVSGSDDSVVGGYVRPYVNAAHAGETVGVWYSLNDDYQLISIGYYLDSAPDQVIPIVDSGSGWSFVMPAANVTLTAVFRSNTQPAGGGTVTSAAELADALGGTESTTVQDGRVLLTRNIVLSHMLDITNGTMVLDLNGHMIQGPDSTGPATAVIRVGGSADFTLTSGGDTAGAEGRIWAGKADAGPSYGIWVQGGSFRMDGGLCVWGGSDKTAGGVSSPGYYQTGGAASLGGGASVEGVSGGENGNSGSSEALRITGGSLTVEGGNYWSGSFVAEVDDGGYAAGCVTLSGSGKLTITGGCFYGYAGCTVTMTGGSLNVSGGEFVRGRQGTFQFPAGTGLADYMAAGCQAAWGISPMTEEQLHASELDGDIRVGRPYPITVTPAEHGRVTLSAASAMPGAQVTVTPRPDAGYRLTSLTWEKEGAGYRYPVDLDKDSGKYILFASDEPLTVYAEFQPTTAQGWLRETTTFSTEQESWGLSYDIQDQALMEETDTLSAGGRYARLSLLASDGTVAVDQYDYLGDRSYGILTNPDLKPGNYTLCVAVGDQYREVGLFRQDVSFVSATAAGQPWLAGRGGLTTGTTAFDVSAWLECPPPLVPDDLTVEVVDADGNVAARSTNREFRYYGSNDDTSSATGKNDSGTVSTNLYFHFEQFAPLTEGSYTLRYRTAQPVVSSGTGYAFYVSSNVYIQENGDVLAEDHVWRSVTENLAEGSYSAYYWKSPEEQYPLVLVVDDQGRASMDCSTLASLGVESASVTVQGENGDPMASFWVYFSRSGNNKSGPLSLDGLLEYEGLWPFGSGGQSYTQYICPAGLTTLAGSLSGYTGAGSYKLWATGTEDTDSYPLSDLSGFTIDISATALDTVYQFQLHDAEGRMLGNATFVRTARPALSLGGKWYGMFWNDTQTITDASALNIDRADSLLFRYVGPDGRVALGSDLTDAGLTLDLSSVPYGRYRWGAVCQMQSTADGSATWSEERAQGNDDPSGGTSGGGVTGGWYESDVAVPVQYLQRVHPSFRSGVKVARLVPVTVDDVTTAKVTYENGTPAADVTMTVYQILDQTLIRRTAVNIGRGAYTIDSGALGLRGACLFCFTSGGRSLGAWAMDTGKSELTVTFLDWNGAVLQTGTVPLGGSATPPDMTDHVRTGYVFTGWNGSYQNVTRSTAVYATYRKTSFTVDFFVSPGTGKPEAQTVDDGKAVRQPADPVRADYEFLGWYTTPTGGVMWDFEQDTVTTDRILYARWGKAPHSVTVAEDSAHILTLAYPKDGEAREGDSVAWDLTVPEGKRLKAVWWIDSDGVRVDLGQGSSCIMPDKAITLHAGVTDLASLTINVSNVNELTFLHGNLYSQTGEWYYVDFKDQVLTTERSASLSDLEPGEYTLYLTVGGYQEEYSITVDGDTVKDISLSQYYIVIGTVAGYSGLGSLWINASTESGGYAGYTGVDSEGNFMLQGMKAGTYTLEVGSSNGDLNVTGNQITVANGDLKDVKIQIEKSADLKVTLKTEEKEPAFQSYLTLYQDGGYVTSATVGGADGTVCLMENAIKAPGTYTVKLDSLTGKNYAGLAFQSEDVTFRITQEMIDKGTVTAQLTYSYPAQVGLAGLTGPGNLVALSQSEVYPGGFVTLELRCHNNGNADLSAEFQLTLPDGVSYSQGGQPDLKLERVPAGGSATLTATLRVSEQASGLLRIPVTATVGDQTGDFGAAVLTVTGLSLNAPAQTAAGEPFTVYGEALPGSIVTIKDAATGQILAVAQTAGRFYSAQVSLPEGAQALVAVSGSALSQPVAVQVTGKPVAVSNVWYNGVPTVLNEKLGAHAFWQYVDLSLMGSPLSLETAFQNGGGISAVTYHFCGQAFPAVNEAGRWQAVLDGWGGSGLKTVTADVTTSGGTFTLTVAVVNLLIDPSGVVTDEQGKPLEGVTVTCQVLTASGAWENWDAESYGDVNPKITDSEGKYGWMVPDGTYRVLASKEGYEDYDSLTDEQFAKGGASSIIIPPPRADIDFVMKVKTLAVYPVASEQGTVTVTSAEARVGETVTVTAEANDGYRLTGLSVRTVSGAPVEVSLSEGTGSFVMPGADVQVMGIYDAIAAPAVEIKSVVGDSVAVLVSNANGQEAELMVALYNDGSQMIGVGRANVSEDGTVYVTVPGAEEAVRIKAFLLNGLCPLSTQAMWEK